MKKPCTTESRPADEHWLAGGGAMGELIRSMDWSLTPLGPITAWPQSLRTTVSLCLASNFPIALAWGEECIQIYNDGYVPICGAKHPRSLGQDFRECWASALPAIGEAFRKAQLGEASFLENQRMFLDRRGYLEETFFTFSFSPIRDEIGQVVGLFHPVNETTAKMLSMRRTRSLRDLGNSAGKARSSEEALTLAVQTLADYNLDLPFVLIYSLDQAGRTACLAANCGLSSPEMVLKLTASSPWGLDRAIASGAGTLLERSSFGPLTECGPYPEQPTLAFSCPVFLPGADEVAALLVLGISARLPFDDDYRGYCEQVAAAVTTALAHARAYEEERKRAEMLAELDRAKTLFFSNVSHEFRTPLMLMLGPLERLLYEGGLAPGQSEQMDVVHRNSLRLLKLVNVLLDFSRLEAGRLEARFTPVDISLRTKELASLFRSALQQAGIDLVLDCPPLGQPAYLDPEMWEKIVLNLISNAFKFTSTGFIAVRLRLAPGSFQLTVEDSGCGIAADQLERIFDRFYRVEGARGRTHEGSGIGLSLVRELVALHGGTVQAASAPGKGTTFNVSLPTGCGHLPKGQILPESAHDGVADLGRSYLAEALGWRSESSPAPEQEWSEPLSGSAASACHGPGVHDDKTVPPLVLLADDNADMRDYVGRILAEHYRVRAVADGEQALAAVRAEPPDLVLSDIMMPRLDGLGLLKELRSGAATQALPVVFISARAGEEARIQGLEAGADDYLIKPFTARDLLARVQSNLELARLRREAARREQEAVDAARFLDAVRESKERYRELVQHANSAILRFDRDGQVVFFNEYAQKFFGYSLDEILGRDVGILVPKGDSLGSDLTSLVQDIFADPVRYASHENENVCSDGRRVWVQWTNKPICDGNGQVSEILAIGSDITQRKMAEVALRRSEERLRLAYAVNQAGAWEWDLATDTHIWSDELWHVFGLQPFSATPCYETWLGIVHPEDRAATEAALQDAVRSGVELALEWRLAAGDGTTRWLATRGKPHYAASGQLASYIGIVFDITARKWAELELLGHRDYLDLVVKERTRELEERNAQLRAEIEERRRSEAVVSRYASEVEGLYNNAPCGYHSLDAQGTVVRINDTELRWLRYRREEVVGVKGGAELYHRGAELFPGLFARLAREGCLRDVELEMVREDGTRFPVLTNSDAVYDEGGRFCGARSVIYDNSLRKLAEDAVRASESRLSTLVTAVNSVYRMSADWGKMLMLRSPGFLVDTLVPNDAWLEQYVAAEDREAVLAAAAEVVRSKGIFEMEHRVHRVDGRIGWVASRAVPLLDQAGEVVEWFGAASDITARKEAEQALLDSELQFRRMAEAIDEVFWFATPSFDRVLYVSPAFERVWGRPVREFYAVPRMWLDTVFPADLPELLHSLERMKAGGDVEVEYRIVRPDGAVRWLRALGYALTDDAGNPFITGVAADITERKMAEELQKATVDLLGLCNESVDWPQLVDNLRAFFKDFTGCGQVLVRQQCCRVPVQQPRDAACAAGTVCPLSGSRDWHAILMDSSCCSCLCRRALAGKLEPLDGNCTATGGFWSNDFLELVNIRHAAQVCVRCAESGYRSVALLPLRTQQENLGVLMVADTRPGLLSERTVSNLEMLSGYAVIALSKMKRDEELRQKSIDLLQAQEVGRIGSYVWDCRGDVWSSSSILNQILGIGEEYPRTLAGWEERVHPVDLPDMRGYLRGVLERRENFDREYRIVRLNDGVEGWVHGKGLVEYEVDGTPIRMVGTIQDITERKEAHQRILDYNRRLVDVEEDLRKRIALELHDDVGQELAVLGLNLSFIGGALPRGNKLLQERLKVAHNLVAEVGATVRTLMMDLRPVQLEEYGLGPALRMHCEMYTRRTGIEIELRVEDGLQVLGGAREVALFRIVQEALTNVAKHADAGKVVLDLRTAGEGVRLLVADDGNGLPKGGHAKVFSGWGLANMRDRVEQMGGRFQIDSLPGLGTRIIVVLPRRGDPNVRCR